MLTALVGAGDCCVACPAVSLGKGSDCISGLGVSGAAGLLSSGSAAGAASIFACAAGDSCGVDAASCVVPSAGGAASESAASLSDLGRSLRRRCEEAAAAAGAGAGCGFGASAFSSFFSGSGFGCGSGSGGGTTFTSTLSGSGGVVCHWGSWRNSNAATKRCRPRDVRTPPPTSSRSFLANTSIA